MVIVIKFYGENCPACKQLDKFIEQEGYKIVKSYNIDTELGADFAMEFGIRSIPALVRLDDDNQIQDSVIGFDVRNVRLFFDGD